MTTATCAVCVTFHIKPAFFDQFLVAVNLQAKNSKELEPWCQQFDVSTNPEQPNTVLLYETYDDRAAFIEKHRTTSHFAAFIQTITDWVDSKELGIWDIQ
jgi:(4S)-4-hydroxy-5-phosphonooxypentane-2,3-dione isomerase